MAGHSHWAGIKHKKGVNDAKRGKIFSKHARFITTAARLGGGDPEMNLRLKYAIDRARADNMPKDNIERAVKKGTGELAGESFETVFYEGYLAGGVALLIDALTDNRHRTAPDLRLALERHGGNLAAQGAVSWMFEQKAVFRVAEGASVTEDELLEIAADAGADDVKSSGGEFEIIGDPKHFGQVRDALAKRKVSLRFAEITHLPKSLVEVKSPDLARQILAALDELDNNEDVQNTFANFDMSEELLKSLET